jgi:hypothetical protein
MIKDFLLQMFCWAVLAGQREERGSKKKELHNYENNPYGGKKSTLFINTPPLLTTSHLLLLY